MSKLGVAGTEAGQRRLNGPQTTGRTYRNLSTPDFEIDATLMDAAIPMRDGITLLADIYRPRTDGPVPALLAASPYPRQLQNSGAPMGFVEAGASDYFVPRGYAHVIANVRGTCGSGGAYTFFDPIERTDMYDAVEWVAAQPWCNGEVGTIGISAFAMAQLQAAAAKPPHLRALFAPAATADVYEAAYHGGVLSVSFVNAWLRSVARFSDIDEKHWRGHIAGLVETILRTPPIHARFAHFDGEAALGVLKAAMHGPLPPPFDALIERCMVDDQVKDEFWQSRDVTALLGDVRVPAYLGCDWQNVPLHLPGTFASYAALPADARKRLALLGEFGLAWPWESLHVEALAWFDHWLKARDTGIMEGPPIRYVVPGEVEERWCEADTWPPAACQDMALALRSDGVLAAVEGDAGTRDYLVLSAALTGLGSDTAATLTWASAPLGESLTLVGPVQLSLDATSSGGDVAFLALLQDVAPDGSVVDVTAGSRRAAIDDDFAALHEVPAGAPRRYPVRLVDNARYFGVGHRIQLLLRSDDSTGSSPMMKFAHAPIGGASRVTIASSSRLHLSVMPNGTPPAMPV